MALFTPERNRTPDLYSPPPELLEGIREMVESANMGEMSHERANDLIAFLLSAWLNAAISQIAGEALERDIMQSLSSGLREWSENNGKR